jgi:hypothetical protein
MIVEEGGKEGEAMQHQQQQEGRKEGGDRQ